MHKRKKGSHGCLTNLLFAVLVIVLAFFVYKVITGLGSARIIINELSVAEKTKRSGETIEGSILISLKLKNAGSQPGSFTLDIENYIEAQKLEGVKPGRVWSLKSELYFPQQDKWITVANPDLWTGSKITPGALSIKLEKDSGLDLQAYLKGSRGWRIKLPNLPEIESNTDMPIPNRLKVSLLSPTGKAADTREIEF
jgi:nitrogen fixation protein